MALSVYESWGPQTNWAVDNIVISSLFIGTYFWWQHF